MSNLHWKSCFLFVRRNGMYVHMHHSFVQRTSRYVCTILLYKQTECTYVRTYRSFVQSNDAYYFFIERNGTYVPFLWYVNTRNRMFMEMEEMEHL